MNFFQKIFLLFGSFFILFFSSPEYSFSQYQWSSNKGCNNVVISGEKQDTDGNIYSDSQYITWEITVDDKNGRYQVVADNNIWGQDYASPIIDLSQLGGGSNGRISGVIYKSSYDNQFDYDTAKKGNLTHTITVQRLSAQGDREEYCRLANAYVVAPPQSPPSKYTGTSCTLNVSSNTDSEGRQFTPSTTTWVTGTVSPVGYIRPRVNFQNISYDINNTPTNSVRINNAGGALVKNYQTNYPQQTPPTGNGPFGFEAQISPNLSEGEYHAAITMYVYDEAQSGGIYVNCTYGPFFIDKDGGHIVAPTNTPTPIPTVKPGDPTYTPTPPKRPQPTIRPLCVQIGRADPNGECIKCIEGKTLGGKVGIWTAIGCIPTNPVDILNITIFGPVGVGGIGFGIAGGVAFLYFLYGAFLILTSMGNAERISQGKEIMISSISGLLLIIFSIFIIRVIGVDILRIPGIGPAPTPTP